jgi:hypothetical protein
MGFLAILVAVAALVIIGLLVLGYSISLPVCVLEKKPAWESLKRGWSLGKGTRWRIFVMFLLVIALSMIASTVSYLAFTIVALVAASIGHGAQYATVAAVAGAVLQAIVSLGAQIVLQPVSWIALVLFYYDQRIRGEGYDIERLMERAGMTQPPPAPIQIANGPSITNSETAPGIISAPATPAHTLPTDTVEDR